MQRINLDHAAGTPMAPDVKQAMATVFEELGNPSAIHEAGRRAKQAMEQARKRVAALLNAKPSEIFFASCGTESNNWAIRGLFAANKRKGVHLVISAIEHPSVSLAARRLEQEGASVAVLPVDAEGIVSFPALKSALRPDTVLVSIMLANGEVGTIEPIKELAALAHEQGALVHTDAVAAAGWVPIDVKALGIDALSLAANAFGGPPGAAAMYVRDGVRILSMLDGGGQEAGFRSGTENVPAIIGMGLAAEIAARDLSPRAQRVGPLRDRLRDGLAARIEKLRANGSWAARLPHNLHVCIDGVSSESLVLGLDEAGLAVGLGSACNSKAMRPSHVLKAMGLTDKQAKGALVFTLGAETTEAEIDRTLEIIPAVVQRLRNVTALTSRA